MKTTTFIAAAGLFGLSFSAVLPLGFDGLNQHSDGTVAMQESAFRTGTVAQQDLRDQDEFRGRVEILRRPQLCRFFPDLFLCQE